jgi:hypothetical protein
MENLMLTVINESNWKSWKFNWNKLLNKAVFDGAESSLLLDYVSFFASQGDAEEIVGVLANLVSPRFPDRALVILNFLRNMRWGNVDRFISQLAMGNFLEVAVAHRRSLHSVRLSIVSFFVDGDFPVFTSDDEVMFALSLLFDLREDSFADQLHSSAIQRVKDGMLCSLMVKGVGNLLIEISKDLDDQRWVDLLFELLGSVIVVNEQTVEVVLDCCFDSFQSVLLAIVRHQRIDLFLWHILILLRQISSVAYLPIERINDSFVCAFRVSSFSKDNMDLLFRLCFDLNKNASYPLIGSQHLASLALSICLGTCYESELLAQLTRSVRASPFNAFQCYRARSIEKLMGNLSDPVLRFFEEISTHFFGADNLTSLPRESARRGFEGPDFFAEDDVSHTCSSSALFPR